MLQLIYGGAATGKTYTVMQKIKADVDTSKSAVLIVPEQFSFESEKAVFSLLNDRLAKNVEVLSFTSLAENISKQYGFNKEMLSDSDKIIFMVKTLKSLSDVLPMWRKYISSYRFAERVVDMIGEFKVSAVTPELLENAAQELETGILKEKIKALSLVWRAYDSMIESRFIDPADKLTVLYRQLKESDYFKGKNVYIDSFRGFTGQQLKIIELILKKADKLTVTGLCDDLQKENYDLFQNSRNTLRSIIFLAQKNHIKVLPEIKLSKTFYQTVEMKKVEAVLRQNINDEFEFTTKNVGFCRATSKEDEAAFVAARIRCLVRENNLRYKDFAVIARNTADYETAVESEFAKNGIPVFFDKRFMYNQSPVYRLVSAALGCIFSYSSADVLNFVKTRLVDGFSDDDISLLENYVMLWTVEGNLWEKEWDMDPDGFVASDNEYEDDALRKEKELEKINALRKTAITPLLNLKKALNGSAENMAKAVFLLLKDCKTDKIMQDFLKRLPSNVSAEDTDAFRQSYQKTIEILDGLVRCFKNENIGIESFINAFDVASSLTTVGRIPQLIDQVNFASADRICPSGFKYIFIIGANQGTFPAIPENNSLLANSERKKLFDKGLELRDKTLAVSVEENILVYSCICAASHGVFISLNTAAGEPSGFFDLLRNNFKLADDIDYLNDIDKYCLPETQQAGFDMLCRDYMVAPENAQALKEAVLSYQSNKEKYENTVTAFADRDISLTPSTAQKLYTNRINGSATRFDTYHRCHFQYFCRYGLNTKKFQPATLDVMQRGTLVHFVFEQFCNRHKQDIGNVSEQTVLAETKEFTNLYFSLIKGSESLFTPRFMFLLRKIKEGIYDSLLRMVKEFSQSKFRPECCEVSIKNDGVIEPVEFNFEKGKFVLYGSIDRLDTFSSYIRIVDYKTGTKKFSISDTLYGQNMQMLLYLYAVIRGGNKNYNTKKPAGILYMPSKLDIEKQGLAMNGLLCDDISVVIAMEEENKGEFVPEFKINKNGTPSKSNNSFVSYNDFETLFDYIEKLVGDMGNALLEGDVSVDPIDGVDGSACKYCDYKAICGIEDKQHKQIENLNNNEVLSRMRGEDGEV